MIESLIVYIGLTFLLFKLTSKAAGEKNYRTTNVNRNQYVYLIISVLLFSLVFGMRYYVGVDYPTYLDIYQAADYRMERFEPAFISLTELCQKYKFHYSLYFGIISGIQISLIFVALRSRIDVLPWLCFVLMFSGAAICNMTNGLRQWIAMCLCILSVSYLDWSKKYKLIICFALIFLGTLFHRSCYIFLIIPFVFIFKGNYFNNKIVQYSLLLLFFFLALTRTITPLQGILESGAFFLDYENYLDNISLEGNTSIGFFDMIELVFYLIIIYFSDKVRAYYNSKLFDIIYSIAFIGILLDILMMGSLMLQRVVLYFYVFYYILAAFYLNYMSKQKSQEIRKAFVFLMVFFSLSFARTMMLMETNTAQYVFFFQDDMHAIKEHQRGMRNINVN